MIHRISIPSTADRFEYESKETDTLWDMVKMLENKLQTTHHFLSIYQDYYLSQKLTYGCYSTPLSSFTSKKWYITIEPDRVKLFDKKYASSSLSSSDQGEKIIYDFTDFEEIVNETLSNTLYQVSTNPLHKNRDVEIRLSSDRINEIVNYVLPKMMYSYHETDEMGRAHHSRTSYDVIKLSIDQTDKRLSNPLLQQVQRVIFQYDNDPERIEKGKKVYLLL